MKRNGQKALVLRAKNGKGKKQGFNKGNPRLGQKTIVQGSWTREQRIVRTERLKASPVTITSSSSASVFSALAFALSDVQNSSDFSNLYDQFRFTRVDVLHIPQNTVGPSMGTAVGAPLMYVAIDLDDNTTATLTSITQYENVQVYGMNERWTLSFVPRASVALYAGGVFTGYSLMDPGAWVDLAQSNAVAFYGLKTVVPQVNAGAVTQSAYILRYHLEFRSTI